MDTQKPTTATTLEALIALVRALAQQAAREAFAKRPEAPASERGV